MSMSKGILGGQERILEPRTLVSSSQGVASVKACIRAVIVVFAYHVASAEVVGQAQHRKGEANVQ